MKGSKFKTKPYKHQLACLNRFGREEYFALLAEMGTGKTWIVINNMAQLWASAECDAVLIFAPNGVHTNWTLQEFPKHMPDWVRTKIAAWHATPNKKERAALDDLYKTNEERALRILVMNWEALQNKKGQEAAMRFALSAMRLMIVADESDNMKNPSTQRAKSMMNLKPLSQFRRIMSGTPVNNSPFDLFSQFLFLHQSILGTDSFYAFKAEYAEMLQDGHKLLEHIKQKMNRKGFTPQVVARDASGRPKYRNLEKLQKLIAPHSFRILKEECLDLPKKIYKTAWFNLTAEQQRVYKKAKDECRLVFESNETPFNKLASYMKLAQITSGYYLHPLAEEPVRIEGDNPKLDLLVDRVKQVVAQGSKFIIWARYRIEIADIAKRLREEGISFVEYHGGVSKKDRVQNIDDFERGDKQGFLGNQQSGGVGITLVVAEYVFYFSNNWSLRDRLQSEDRAHRIGQDKNVTYINVAARGTVDELVIGAIEQKKDIATFIVDNGRNLFK